MCILKSLLPPFIVELRRIALFRCHLRPMINWFCFLCARGAGYSIRENTRPLGLLSVHYHAILHCRES